MSYEPGTLSKGESWSVVLPVKMLRDAKSRLSPIAAGDRAELALAMALDTVEATAASAAVARVVVVTDDAEAAEAGREIGAYVVPDVPGAGLNAALDHGAAEAASRWPGNGVLALSADLPALRHEELTAVLAAAGAHQRAFLSDASGVGTVALTARPGVPLRPEFGADSAARHRLAGAVELVVAALSVRRDVDTVADLETALGLGCGPRTTSVAERLGVTRQT